LQSLVLQREEDICFQDRTFWKTVTRVYSESYLGIHFFVWYIHLCKCLSLKTGNLCNKKKETYRFSWSESLDEMHVMLGEDT